MTASYLVAGVRTPIGRFHGGLAPMRAVELGSIAIAAALERAGVAPDQVDYVIMGHVLQAGQGQITSRQAAVEPDPDRGSPRSRSTRCVRSGFPRSRPADQMIRAGEIELAVAGGMESMTNAPYVIPNARRPAFGQRRCSTP